MFHSISSYCCSDKTPADKRPNKCSAPVLTDVFFSALAVVGLTFAGLSLSGVNLGPLNTVSQYLGSEGVKILAAGTGAFIGLQFLFFAICQCKKTGSRQSNHSISPSSIRSAAKTNTQERADNLSPTQDVKSATETSQDNTTGMPLKGQEENRAPTGQIFASHGIKITMAPPSAFDDLDETHERPPAEESERLGNSILFTNPLLKQSLSNTESDALNQLRDSEIDPDLLIAQLVRDVPVVTSMIESRLKEDNNPEDELQLAEAAMEWATVQRELARSFIPPVPPLSSSFTVELPPPPPLPMANQEIQQLVQQVEEGQASLRRAIEDKRKRLRHQETHQWEGPTLNKEIENTKKALKPTNTKNAEKKDPTLESITTAKNQLRKVETEVKEKKGTEPGLMDLSLKILKATRLISEKITESVHTDFSDDEDEWATSSNEGSFHFASESGNEVANKQKGVQLETGIPNYKPSEWMGMARERALQNQESDTHQALMKALKKNRAFIQDSLIMDSNSSSQIE